MSARFASPHPQQGIALPVMLIMLLVMLVSSIYLLRSSNSTTLTATNLAQDSALARAADLGLHTGFRWLSETAQTGKAQLNRHVPEQGYRANLDTTLTVRSSEFWDGSRELVDAAGNRIRYVIHRMCSFDGAYSEGNNACMQTAANTSQLGNTVRLGDSLASDSPVYAGVPQLHYVITARIDGPRGGNVVTQMVVLIGA
ncbi:pilus assembly PilX family protein [Massilia varians]